MKKLIKTLVIIILLVSLYYLPYYFGIPYVSAVILGIYCGILGKFIVDWCDEIEI